MEVNLEEKGDVVKPEEGVELVDRQTNGGVVAELNGTANMENKDIVNEVEAAKVWL